MIYEIRTFFDQAGNELPFVKQVEGRNRPVSFSVNRKYTAHRSTPSEYIAPATLTSKNREVSDWTGQLSDQ